MKRSWRGLVRLFDHSRRLVGLSFLVAALQSAMLLPVALVVRHVFDTQIPGGDTGGIVVSGVLLLGLYLGSAGLGLLARGLVVGSTKQAVARLRLELLTRLYALPRSWYDRRRTGLVHSVVVQDSERVDQMINQLVTQTIPAVLVTVALSAVGVVINPLLFAVLLAVFPVPLLLGRRLGRVLRRRVQTWQDAFDAFSADTELALRAMTLTKVEGAEGWELARRGPQIAELSEAGRRLVWAQATYTAVQAAVAATAGVVVLVVGGITVAQGSMTLGELLSFYAIVALILRQLGIIQPGIPIIILGTESLARLERLLDTDEREPYGGERSLTFEGRLELQGATFGYGSEPTVRDVSLVVEPGEHVALVGPNGAGKSTLVSLMLGLYRPETGRVLADGVAFDELDLRALRQQVGVVLQDPVLFAGSIRDNIAYGRPDVGDEAVQAAAQAATAADFIAALPGGYDTQVGDEGMLLSGGERQRVAIARALVGEPSLLVLDEPTTYLDDPAIAALVANLESLPNRPAVVIVTHDLGVATRTDRLVHLRDGRIVRSERGERSELRFAGGGVA